MPKFSLDEEAGKGFCHVMLAVRAGWSEAPNQNTAHFALLRGTAMRNVHQPFTVQDAIESGR